MLDILNQLSATSKRTEKEAILTALIGTDREALFKRIAIATYSGDINYWVKKYPRAKTNSGVFMLDYALDCLTNLSTRQVTGNAALKFLTELESHLSADDSEVLNRIIARDLKCGMTEGTANRIWPGLVYVEPYQRCSSFNEKNLRKIKFPAFSQTKADGMYINIVVRGGKVEYRSRSGEVKKFNNAERDALFLRYPGYVFMGEALVRDENGDILPRTTGNGILDGSDIDTSRIVFDLWDIVPVADYDAHSCNIEYKTRLASLKTCIKGLSDDLRLIDTRVVNSVQEIIDHFKENVEQGLEGTVIKNQFGLWAHCTSPDQIKVKIEFECELEVYQVNEGTGKNKGKLGALVSKSSDGLVVVAVGGGYKAKERDELFTEDSVKLIIGVKANDLVRDRNRPDVWSLFLPRFTGIRKDKTVADTYTQIREQMDAFIHTLEVIGK